MCFDNANEERTFSQARNRADRSQRTTFTWCNRWPSASTRIVILWTRVGNGSGSQPLLLGWMEAWQVGQRAITRAKDSFSKRKLS